MDGGGLLDRVNTLFYFYIAFFFAVVLSLALLSVKVMRLSLEVEEMKRMTVYRALSEEEV